MLNKQDIASAYDYFVKSFILKESLSVVLIGYARFVLIDYIKQNEAIFNDFDIYYPNTTGSNELKPFIYQTDAGYSYSSLLKEISFFHTEIYSFYIVVLCYAFDVNISISSVFNDVNKIHYDNLEIKPKIESLIEDKRNAIPDITLFNNCLYNYNNNNNKSLDVNNLNEVGAGLGFNVAYDINNLSVFKINSNLYEKVYNNELIYKDVNSIHLIKSDLVNKCSLCGKNNDKIYSKIPELDSYSVYYCSVCLEAALKKVINSRLGSITKEKYLYQECK